MHPYLAFTALPIAAAAAWFAAPLWSDSDPGRYRVPSVAQIEDPSAPVTVGQQSFENPDIRIAAFLPHLPPRPPVPTPALILHSVMTGTDVHLATINGEVLREGARVEGYLVSRVTAEGVELIRGEEVRWLPMRPLHELPPPIEPGTDPVQKNAAAAVDKADRSRDFWATFDS